MANKKKNRGILFVDWGEMQRDQIEQMGISNYLVHQLNKTDDK